MTNQCAPKASVIMPIYNAEKYLYTAIESILNQTFREFELLLLNDGSTDGSEQIIDFFCRKDSRCKKFCWPNSGIVETLNKGIEEAQSDIIFRMDADDLCHPQRFEKQWRYLDMHPDCVALGTKVMLIDEAGMLLKEFAGEESHAEIDKQHIAGQGGAIVHPSAMIRKESIIKVGGYDKNYPHAQDLDLFLKLAEVGKLTNIPETLLYYRQHLTSVGYTKRQKQFQYAINAVNSAKERRGLVFDSDSKHVGVESPSLQDIYRKWAWWAIQAKNKKTAKKYAFKAIKSDPFNRQNLKLFLCSFRGY